MANIVPDTNTREVAAFAVAWEIVRVAYNVPNTMNFGEEKLKESTNAVVKSYLALVTTKPIEGK